MQDKDHDLLIRIDERVGRLLKQLPALERRVSELEDTKTKWVGYGCGAMAVISVLTEVVKVLIK